MKKLVKLLVLIVCICVLSATLSGCAHKGYCEDCGQYEKLNKFVERDGDVHWYCDTCYQLEKMFS